MARKPKSFKQKLTKAEVEMQYLDGVEPISDAEMLQTFFPDVSIPVAKQGMKYAMDSATGNCTGMTPCEFNGPIPAGAWREIPPSHLIGANGQMFKGILGKILRHFAARNFFIGDQINGWFGQNCFVYKACAMPGDDAVACGYKISGKDKKFCKSFCSLTSEEDFNLDESLRQFECFKRMYGGAILCPCFEEDVDMSVPLCDWSALKGKTFLGWTVIEPYYLAPDFEPNSRELTDPTYKFYLTPTYWNVMGNSDRRIHRSWLFFRRHMATAKIYQPMYKFLGPSVPQMILERLYSAEVCANEASMLMRAKRSFTMEADLRKLVANPEYAKKFLKNCAGNSDNWGIKILPEGSNAKQMDTLLTECMPLTLAQYGILCAEIGIPAPKFMMAQLTGFANSGNYELKLYADKERELENKDLIPIIKRTYKFMAACAGNSEMDIDVEFNDMDIPTVMEKADIAYQAARADKFIAEAKAVKKMADAKSAETHKSTSEQLGADTNK